MESKGRSLPVFFVLFIVFLVLKLTGNIAWSWWWITAPLWGPFSVLFGAFGAVFLGAVICQGEKPAS